MVVWLLSGERRSTRPAGGYCLRHRANLGGDEDGEIDSELSQDSETSVPGCGELLDLEL